MYGVGLRRENVCHWCGSHDFLANGILPATVHGPPASSGHSKRSNQLTVEECLSEFLHYSLDFTVLALENPRALGEEVACSSLLCHDWHCASFTVLKLQFSEAMWSSCFDTKPVPLLEVSTLVKAAYLAELHRWQQFTTVGLLPICYNTNRRKRLRSLCRSF